MNSQQADCVVVLGTSAPNRFRTTASVLEYLYSAGVITQFEVECVSIHYRGEIVITFGTSFCARLFALKLRRLEIPLFQIIRVCGGEFDISQYCMLNLCVERRSRNGNRNENIIRRWRGASMIDCNADRRQIYLYLFDFESSQSNKTDNLYLRVCIDDRSVHKICILHNNYCGALEIEISDPPKIEVFRSQTAHVLSIDESKKDKQDLNDPSSNDAICPRVLLNGSCNNKSCSFDHSKPVSNPLRSGNGNGNNLEFWKRSPFHAHNDSDSDDSDCNDCDDNDNNDKDNDQDNDCANRNDWAPAAYCSLTQRTKNKHASQYTLDRKSDSMHDSEYPQWTFETEGASNSAVDFMKLVGQSWIYRIEFVGCAEVAERYVNAIRQMRIAPECISEVFSDYEGHCSIPLIFESKNHSNYYHPPFSYCASAKSNVLRLKRQLHDLDYAGAHDVAFALEACLHNFPAAFIPEDLVDSKHPNIFFKCLFQEINDSGSEETNGNTDAVWQALMHCANNQEWKDDRVLANNKSNVEKCHVLPVLELFYKSLDWSTNNLRVLKQKKMESAIILM